MRSDNKVVSLSAAGHEFVQVAKALAAGRVRAEDVQRWARSIPSPRVRDVLKSGVVPNYLATNAGSELAPYKELATGFFGSLAGQSAVLENIQRRRLHENSTADADQCPGHCAGWIRSFRAGPKKYHIDGFFYGNA